MTQEKIVCVLCGRDGHRASNCPWLAVTPSAMASLPACMGGWCTKRDQCGRHLTSDRRNFVERLCQPGDEQPEPIGLAAWVSAAMRADQQPVAT